MGLQVGGLPEDLDFIGSAESMPKGGYVTLAANKRLSFVSG